MRATPGSQPARPSLSELLDRGVPENSARQWTRHKRSALANSARRPGDLGNECVALHNSRPRPAAARRFQSAIMACRAPLPAATAAPSAPSPADPGRSAGVLSPRANRPAASSRNRSRRCCSAGVYPPRCAYRMLWSYESARPASLPPAAGLYEFKEIITTRMEWAHCPGTACMNRTNPKRGGCGPEPGNHGTLKKFFRSAKTALNSHPGGAVSNG
jgi:hypothetical protein